MWTMEASRPHMEVRICTLISIELSQLKFVRTRSTSTSIMCLHPTLLHCKISVKGPLRLVLLAH